MDIISTRGMSQRKVCDVRLALEQICSDCHNPRTMTAQIMASLGVSMRDVLNVCDMARDVVVAWRERPDVAMPAGKRPESQATAQRKDDDVRAKIERLKAQAMGQSNG